MSAFDWHNTVTVPGRTARRALVWLAAALTLAATGAASAQGANSIDSLMVSKGSSGNTIVKFTLKSPPANPPAGFAISNPPRIALDFLDTSNGLGSTQRIIDDPAMRSLNVIQAGNRTRVVFNLNKPQTFSTNVEGNTVLVTLFDQSQQLDAKTQVVERFAEARPGDATHALRDVDFRRGANGEGRVVVDMSDNATGIDIRQQGKNLIVDFIKTNLPRNLERRLDVQDFGTPIVAVDTFNQGGNTRMVIEPKGLWEHSAYQTDNKFILEVRAVQEDPNKLIQGAKLGFKGEKLSLNFQNVEVRSVLQVIADFTGLNIITSDTVTGSLTLRLKDIPWDQALEIIMQTKGLDMRKNGNVVLIAPREELARQGAAAARERPADPGARAAGDGVLPAQLHEGVGLPADPVVEPAAAVRCRRGPDGDDRRAGLDPVPARRRVRRPAHERPVRAGHCGRAGGSAQDHPPARHADPPSHDRGTDRHRKRQVQQAARRALRRADGVHVQQIRRRTGRQPRHATGRPSAGRQDRPRHADADAVRARVGHRVCGVFRQPAAQRQPAGHQPRPGSSR